MTLSPPDPCGSPQYLTYQIKPGEGDNTYMIVDPCATGGSTYETSNQTPQELHAAVLTMYGKKVFETTTQTGSVTIEGVNPGMYLLKILIGEQLITERIIVK